MAENKENTAGQNAPGEQGTQRSRFGGAPVEPIRPRQSAEDESEVDQDPGERQKRNQNDIEEDKLAS